MDSSGRFRNGEFHGRPTAKSCFTIKALLFEPNEYLLWKNNGKTGNCPLCLMEKLENLCLSGKQFLIKKKQRLS